MLNGEENQIQASVKLPLNYVENWEEEKEVDNSS